MDDLILTLLLLLVPILTVGAPVLLSVAINRFLKKREVKPIWRILSLTPILIVGYIIHGAYYPSEEFYKNDFKDVTGIDLIDSAKFKYKTVGFPDHHGDYMSVSLIQLDSETYKDLPEELLNNKLTENSNRLGGKEMDKAKKKLKNLTIEKEFSRSADGVFYYVAFLSDHKSILVQRSSS